MNCSKLRPAIRDRAVMLGALKGMANTGIRGMLIGATLLGHGYQIFTEWLVANSDIPKALAERESQADSS